MIFAGKKVQYRGKVFRMPLPDSQGKAIKIAHEPADIPVYLATLGPNALRYTGEAANGWLGTSFSPDQPDAQLGYLRQGAAQAQRTLSDLDLCVSVRIELGDDLEAIIAKRKPAVAFNMGGMGSAKTNFYNDAFKRAGYADDALAIQRLWQDGKRDEAARRVPDDMVTQFQALGDTATVTQRLRAYRDAGVTTLKLGLDGAGPIGPARYELLEQIVDITGAL